MISRADILSMEFLKKSAYTGSHQGMRYRLEKVEQEEERQLKVTVWPEPYNFSATPQTEKTSHLFSFDEDGVEDSIAWMNDILFEQKHRFKSSYPAR